MAKDSEGKKFNRIPEHTKVVNGKRLQFVNIFAAIEVIQRVLLKRNNFFEDILS